MAEQDQSRLPVNASVITWARKRAGYSLEEAAQHHKKIEEWENGASMPTYPQLEAMSERFKCPIAVFFFPSPPEIEDIKTSFRTVPAEAFESLPRNVRALIRKAKAMQFNLEELQEGVTPNRLITRDLEFDVSTDVGAIAEAVREYLGISVAQQSSWRNVNDALDHWRTALTDAGVFAFKDQFHEPDHFGFCLFDAEHPIIYVNNSSAKSRQIFTLFHELAHLLFRTSGIDGPFGGELSPTSRRIEVMCNDFANQFLVPDSDFDLRIANIEADRDSANELARLYSVSREVIYRKFLDRGLIARAEYRDAVEAWAQEGAGPRAPGGNYYYTQIAYLGPHYIDLALNRYQQGRFDVEQLADYLNVKPKNVGALEEAYMRIT